MGEIRHNPAVCVTVVGGIVTGTTLQQIVAPLTCKGIVSRITGQCVLCIVSRQRIRIGTADKIFDVLQLVFAAGFGILYAGI